MNLILFFIFLLCDLMMVPICWFSFGKQSEYREGMLLGVHIPSDCIGDPEVSAICTRQEKDWKRFQRINLVISILVCFLSLWDFLIFIVMWTIWLAEYIGGIYYLIIIPHRKMYRLKIRRGWVKESTRRLVRIDTSVSAVSDRLAVDWKWHLPVIILTAATVFFVLGMDQRYGMDPAELEVVWIMYGTGVGICVLFMALHIGIMSQANRVYSENSDINLSVNRLTKRAWTSGLVYASWTNGAAWIFMAAGYYIAGPDLPSWIYVVYSILLTVGAAALLIPIASSVRKRKAVLESDQEAYYTDDDEYWKYGWYNNPDDRHILVQDRFNSMNYSFNWGRPGVKKAGVILYAATIIFVPAIIIWTFSLIASFDNAEVAFAESGGVCSVEAAGYDCEFREDEIASVELIGALPDDDYIRTNGGSTDKVNIGHFRGKETGKCMMFLYKGYSPILEIRLEDGMTVYINSREEKKTEEWYEMAADIG